jgi:PEP-CTERM motif-containing protein
MVFNFRRPLAFVAVVVLLVVVAAPSWAAQVQVYSQAANYLGLYASQNDTSSGGFGPFATAYDDFSLASSATLTQVTWTGGYFNPQSAGSITGWTVTFWSDSGGAPGSALAVFGIAGNAGETFLQNDAIGDPVYGYSAAVNWAATGGTPYWLSVVPDVGFPPQWGWTTSSQGNGISYQVFFGSGSTNPSDLAFSLYATQNTGVPEPGSLMLLGTGVIGLAGMLRRKLGV